MYFLCNYHPDQDTMNAKFSITWLMEEEEMLSSEG